MAHPVAHRHCSTLGPEGPRPDSARRSTHEHAIPIVRQEGEGEQLWWSGGGVFTMKASAEETAGALIMWEFRSEQGKVTPLHLHPNEDEGLYVLEGELLIHLDQKEQVVGEGGVFIVPRGVPHAFKVTSKTARLLTWQTPGTGEPSIETRPIRSAPPKTSHARRIGPLAGGRRALTFDRAARPGTVRSGRVVGPDEPPRFAPMMPPGTTLVPTAVSHVFRMSMPLDDGDVIRHGTHLRTLTLGWGPSGRCSKSTRPARRERPLRRGHTADAELLTDC